MTDWTQIPANTFETDKPVLGSTHLAIVQNFDAMAEGASGAPRIQTAAIQNSAVTAAKLATGGAERDWVLARTAAASAGAVGTYAFAWRDSTATPPSFGSTVAGSQLRPAGFTSSSGVSTSGPLTQFPSGSNIYGSAGTGRSTFSGTWRCMGEAAQSAGDDGNYPHTLWLRIS